jgi:hypothetical protein
LCGIFRDFQKRNKGGKLRDGNDVDQKACDTTSCVASFPVEKENIDFDFDQVLFESKEGWGSPMRFFSKMKSKDQNDIPRNFLLYFRLCVCVIFLQYDIPDLLHIQENKENSIRLNRPHKIEKLDASPWSFPRVSGG